jgi:hypothetical protein
MTSTTKLFGRATSEEYEPEKRCLPEGTLHGVVIICGNVNYIAI